MIRWNWNEDRARRGVDQFLPGDRPSRGLQSIPQTKIPFHLDCRSSHHHRSWNRSLLLLDTLIY